MSYTRNYPVSTVLVANSGSSASLKSVQSGLPPPSGKLEDADLFQREERRQNIDLRNYGFYLALAMIVLTVAMEIVILNCIVMEGDTSIPVAIAVAPIASFTTITIAVLIGVFRGFRSKEAGNLPSALGPFIQ